MDKITVALAFKGKAWSSKVLEYKHRRITNIQQSGFPGLRVYFLVGPDVHVSGSEHLDIVGDKLSVDAAALEPTKPFYDIPAPPVDSPWGAVTKARLCIPDIPIYAVDTAEGDGFMVEVGFGLKYLSDLTLGVRASTIWPSYTAFTRGEDAFYCFSGDTEWLALFWDYPPLADAHQVDVEALEVRLKKHMGEFLERFTKEYPNGESND